MRCAKDGALYAAAYFELDASGFPWKPVTGVLRSVNPTGNDPETELVNLGLQKGTVSDTSYRDVWLESLSVVPAGSNDLLSINQIEDMPITGLPWEKWVSRLVAYKDTLSSAKVALAAPANNALGAGTIVGVAPETVTVSVSWAKLEGAVKYEYAVATDPGFDESTIVKTDITTVTSVTVAGLDPNTVYYWRVRVAKGQPVLSPWSETRKFTTTIGLTVRVPQLLAPAAGATGVPLKPVFTWQPLAGATT